MINKIKTFGFLFLVFFISTNVFASCKFEFIPMKSSFSSFEKKISFGLNSGSVIDDVSSYPVPIEEICKDKEFKMFPVVFSFVKNKLHQIFIEDIFTDIDHLSNLKNIYGEPSDFYEDNYTSGFKYYHWDLVSKHVFLVIKFSPNDSISNIEIVTNEFPKLIEKRNELLEE